MINIQNTLREQAKAAKWCSNISYKAMAAALGMNYNAFMNWLHYEDINLSYTKREKLRKLIAAAAAAAKK